MKLNKKIIFNSTTILTLCLCLIHNNASAGAKTEIRPTGDAKKALGERLIFRSYKEVEAEKRLADERRDREKKEKLERDWRDYAAKLKEREVEKDAEEAKAKGGAAADPIEAPTGGGAPPPPPPPPPKEGPKKASRAGGWKIVDTTSESYKGGSASGKVMEGIKAGNPYGGEIAAGIPSGLAGLKRGMEHVRKDVDPKAAALKLAHNTVEGAKKTIKREEKNLETARRDRNDVAIKLAEEAIIEAESRIIKAEEEIKKLTTVSKVSIKIVKSGGAKPDAGSAPKLPTCKKRVVEAKLEERHAEEKRVKAEEKVLELEKSGGDPVILEIARVDLERVTEEAKEKAAKRVMVEKESAAAEVVESAAGEEISHSETSEKSAPAEVVGSAAGEEISHSETSEKSAPAEVVGSAAGEEISHSETSEKSAPAEVVGSAAGEEISHSETSKDISSGFKESLYLSLLESSGLSYITDDIKINYNTLIKFAAIDNSDVKKIIAGLKDDPDEYYKDFINKIQDTGLSFDIDILQSAKDDSITDQSHQALLYASSLASLTPEQRIIEKEKNESVFKIYSVTSESINALSNSITTRLASINTSFTKPEAGVAAGEGGIAAGDNDEKRPKKLWAMGLIGSSKQGKNGNLIGYKGSFLGGTLGFDIDLQDNLTLGIAYSNITSGFNYNHNKTENAIKARTHGLSLYGKFITNNGLIWQNIASGLLSKVNNTRQNKVMNYIAKGQAKNKAFSLETNLGYPILARELILTPNVGLRYIHSNNGGYKEKGAGTYNLTTTSSTSESYTGTIGGKIAFSTRVSDSLDIVPEIHTSIEKDLKSKLGNSKVKFGWMNGYFENKAKAGDSTNNKISYNIGGNVLLKSSNIETSLGYNCNLKKSYTAHQGFLKISIIF